MKDFIDYTTKSDVVTPAIVVNGLAGVMHGDYWPPQTWIDWWFRKGDLTICIHLGPVEYPVAIPNQEERAEHEAIIASLRFCKDFATEPTPVFE